MRRRSPSLTKKEAADTRVHPFYLPPIPDMPPIPSPSGLLTSPWNHNVPSRSEDRLPTLSHYRNNSQRSRAGSESVARASSSHHHLPPPPVLPVERPPSYTVIRIPDTPATYTFLQEESTLGSMLVIPTPDAPDPRPIYRIAINHEPFLPTCMVTVIIKAPTDQRLPVGRFRTMISQPTHPTQLVSIHGREHKLSDVFSRSDKRKRTHYFDWGVKTSKNSVSLRWSCPDWPSAGTFSCSDPSDETRMFATFSVSENGLQHPADPRTNLEPPRLTVKPVGHFLLDDIILSLLLLERQRLTASMESSIRLDRRSSKFIP
ncbi:hypothetical protein CPC08DRAFT_709445 [Agrocybe pediades]|nr:hypothetical protein CPC08DRAFT_709445 [Agrocybe pediades]